MVDNRGSFDGTPEGTRTPNPQNRNLMLYPLSHRRVCLSIIADFLGKVKSFFPVRRFFSEKLWDQAFFLWDFMNFPTAIWTDTVCPVRQ